MTTQAEIEAQLSAESEKFYTKIYDGTPLPSNFPDICAKVLMAIPPGQHQMPIDKLKLLVNKKSDEVTIIEVGFMINLIFSTPFEKIYPDVNEALDTHEILVKIKDEYRVMTSDFNEKMRAKKERLLSLGGVIRSAPFNNNMKAEA